MAYFEEAVAASRAVRKQYPRKVAVARSVLSDYTGLLMEQGQWERSEKLLKEAIEVGELWARDYPEMPVWQEGTGASTGAKMGLIQFWRDDLASVRISYERCLAYFKAAPDTLNPEDAYGHAFFSCGDMKSSAKHSIVSRSTHRCDGCGLKPWSKSTRS